MADPESDDAFELPSSFELSAGDLTARVLARGAELTSLRKAGTPYLYEGDAPEFWAKSAPILFPTVGRSVGDAWCVEGKTYPMPRHGFARDLAWEPVSGSDTFVELQLSDSKATRKHYPFEFELTATYRLTPEELVASYRLENFEDRAIPFSFGLHPAFRWPLDPATERNAWRVTFPREMRAERVLLEDGLRGKKRAPALKGTDALPLGDGWFKDDAIVLRNPEVESLVLESDASPRKVRLSFTPCTWLGIWSKPGAPFVCLEPWRGVASKTNDVPDVEAKDAIEWLKPGETFDYELRIRPE